MAFSFFNAVIAELTAELSARNVSSPFFGGGDVGVTRQSLYVSRSSVNVPLFDFTSMDFTFGSSNDSTSLSRSSSVVF